MYRLCTHKYISTREYKNVLQFSHFSYVCCEYVALKAEETSFHFFVCVSLGAKSIQMHSFFSLQSVNSYGSDG